MEIQLRSHNLGTSSPSEVNPCSIRVKKHYCLMNSSLISMAQPQEGLLSDAWDVIKGIFAFAFKPFIVVWNTIGSLIMPPMALPSSSSLVDFYLGNTSNAEGVALAQIWGWDDGKLETVHNYIQWLFPEKRASDFNPNAPILDQATIAAFRQDPVLRKNLQHSFHRMLAFYGLQWNASSKKIIRAPNYNARQAVWLTPGNHNFLRISRILACLVHLGLKTHAQAFLDILTDIYQNEGKKVISSETFGLWKKAI